jgi:hypothetical protein
MVASQPNSFAAAAALREATSSNVLAEIGSYVKTGGATFAASGALWEHVASVTTLADVDSDRPRREAGICGPCVQKRVCAKVAQEEEDEEEENDKVCMRKRLRPRWRNIVL